MQLDWPAAMPRTIWELTEGLGIRARDRGEGPMISLRAWEGGHKPVPFRYRVIPGVIGKGPLPLNPLASWSQPGWEADIVLATKDEIDARLALGELPDRLSALQLAFSTAQVYV